MERVKMGDVVKSHRLNMAIQNLSTTEIRLIQLAIIDARECKNGFTSDTSLKLDATRYAEVFNVSRQCAYEALRDAEATLFERRFTFLDEIDGDTIKTRWISQAKYKKGLGSIEIMFSPAVVKEITRLGFDGGLFTQYSLEQTAMLKSIYSIRLYELLNQWKNAKKTPAFELGIFRGQMGLGVNDYNRMSDFKRRVLDLAVQEINEKTDLKVSYEQIKDRSTITHFFFTILQKQKPKAAKSKGFLRDTDNLDMFTVEGLSDKQLGRIARNPSFMADYNHLVKSTSPAGQDTNVWEFEMINRLKKDASQFQKRPIRDYLDY